jgi:hypothetical protein
VAELKTLGVEFVGPSVRNEIGPGLIARGGDASFVCFKDPDGNVLEFIQPHRARPQQA